MSDETQEHSKYLESRDDKERREMLERIDDLNHLRGLDTLDLTGYVYRKNRLRRNESLSLPPVYEILSDDEIGQLYGPGFYLVVYHCKLSSGKKETKSIQYNIGREYLSKHKQYCNETGETFYGNEIEPAKNNAADFFSKDKIESIVAILGALKMVFGNNQPPEQNQFQNLKMLIEPQMQLLERFIVNKPQSLPDSIVSEAFKALSDKRQPKESNLKEQLELFREFKELTEPAAEKEKREAIEEEQNMSPLDKMLSKAIEMLPSFLEAHNGNIQSAATAVQKKKPFEVAMLKSNPKLQLAFFNELVKNQGIQAAKQWALSFGLNAELLAKNVSIIVPKVSAAPTLQPIQETVKKGVIEL